MLYLIFSGDSRILFLTRTHFLQPKQQEQEQEQEEEEGKEEEEEQQQQQQQQPPKTAMVFVGLPSFLTAQNDKHTNNLPTP